MVILVTNITDELSKELIMESFKISKDYNGERAIKEIIFFKPYEKKKFWDLNNEIPINEFKIAMEEDSEKIYEELANVLEPLFDKREYIHVIVDASILGYYILDIIKKFNVKEVFIAKNGELERLQTCICEIE